MVEHAPMHFHLTGILSSFFVVLSLSGIAVQLRLLRNRKREFVNGKLIGERPAAVLSVNRFSTGFMAFFSMFLYGLTLEQFNHYLVWPRVIALGLMLLILFEIQDDRQDRLSKAVFYLCAFLTLVAVVLGFTRYRIVAHSVGLSHGVVMLAIVLYSQGAIHQIYKIRRSGKTGALSQQMHQLFFLKDLSSLLFGVAMGLSQGWPVTLLHGTGLLVHIITLWHFRWVRLRDFVLASSR